MYRSNTKADWNLCSKQLYWRNISYFDPIMLQKNGYECFKVALRNCPNHSSQNFGCCFHLYVRYIQLVCLVKLSSCSLLFLCDVENKLTVKYAFFVVNTEGAHEFSEEEGSHDRLKYGINLEGELPKNNCTYFRKIDDKIRNATHISFPQSF